MTNPIANDNLHLFSTIWLVYNKLGHCRTVQGPYTSSAHCVRAEYLLCLFGWYHVFLNPFRSPFLVRIVLLELQYKVSTQFVPCLLLISFAFKNTSTADWLSNSIQHSKSSYSSSLYASVTLLPCSLLPSVLPSSSVYSSTSSLLLLILLLILLLLTWCCQRHIVLPCLCHIPHPSGSCFCHHSDLRNWPLFCFILLSVPRHIYWSNVPRFYFTNM